MKKPIFLWILLLIPAVIFAQRKNTATLLNEIRTGNDSVRASLYYQLSKNYLRVDLDSCRMFANKSLEYAEKTGNKKVKAEVYSIMGAAEKYEGQYEKAIAHHLRSISIKEELNDTVGLCISNNDIGIIYKNMKRYREALEYYKRSNELALQSNYGKGISMTYGNIGTIYSALHIDDSTLYFYNKALEIARALKDSGSLVVALSNIGEYHGNKGENEKALGYFLQCVPIDSAFDDQYGLTLDYTNIANSLSKMKKYAEATRYLALAEKTAMDSKLNKELIGVYESMYRMYSDQKNYAQALLYLEKSKSLNDSILNEDSQKQVSELNTRYQTAKKEKQIADQKRKIAGQRFWIGGISVFALLGGVIIMQRNRRRRLEAQAKFKEAVYQQQELATRRVIEAEENERQRIATELHDGVGQLMSAAKMNLNSLEDEIEFKSSEQRTSYERCMDLLTESGKEIRIVAHNLMPNVLLKKGLSNAVQEFLNKIHSKVLQVSLHTEGINERIDQNVETVLYRVIQECVNNVIKHSGAGRLDISIIRDTEGIAVTIEDNGKGFDPASVKEKDGIGLQNIRSRIEYLKGSVDFDSAPGRGTVVAIFVPFQS